MRGGKGKYRLRTEWQQINEEYKIWKKNTPFMYDFIISHALQWPSLTVEWLPGREEDPDNDCVVQKLILGTNALDQQPNHLLIARAQLRSDDSENDAPGYDDDQSSSGGYGRPGNKVEVVQKILHEGEVNRARYMPQNESMVATKTVSSEVHLFDCSKHPSTPPSAGTCNPELRLKGHNLEGFGLSWSKLKPGYLLSGSNDAQICMWDINSTPTDKTLNATRTFKANDSIVQDVSWHGSNEHLFASVGDDKYLHMWDLRTPSDTKPANSITAHHAAVTCLAFNPTYEWLVATGSADRTIKLYDARKLSFAFCTFRGHNDPISQVGWNPANKYVLASGCFGRRLHVWDVSRINRERTPEDAKDGPPELLFVHGGHTSRIFDFSWNPSEDCWMMASVAEDNILHLWEMAENIHLDDDDDDDATAKA